MLIFETHIALWLFLVLPQFKTTSGQDTDLCYYDLLKLQGYWTMNCRNRLTPGPCKAEDVDDMLNWVTENGTLIKKLQNVAFPYDRMYTCGFHDITGYTCLRRSVMTNNMLENHVQTWTEWSPPDNNHKYPWRTSMNCPCLTDTRLSYPSLTIYALKHATVYINGIQIGDRFDSLNDISLNTGTNEIAIEVSGGAVVLRGAVYDTDGFRTDLQPNNTKCTETLHTGWYTNGFDHTAWPNATVINDFDGRPPAGVKSLGTNGDKNIIYCKTIHTVQ